MRTTIPVSIHNLKEDEITEEIVIEVYPHQMETPPLEETFSLEGTYVTAYKASAFLDRMPLGIVEIFKDINDFNDRIKDFEQRAIIEATKYMIQIHVTSPSAIFKKHGYA